MDEQNQQGSPDAWFLARLGNAVDAWVDREVRGPQRYYDPSQAYGMDGNGNIYTLGQTNGQISATVTPTRGDAFGGLLPWLLIGGVILLVTSGSK